MSCLACGGKTFRPTIGFVVATETQFNPEYASKDWNYELFKTPSYYTMRLRSKA